MAATEAVSAFGTLLKRGNGASPETFTAVAEITNLEGPNFSMDTVDVTHHTSPNGYREFLPSFKDAGEIAADMNFVPSSSEQDPSTGILSDFENRTLRNWQVVFPDDSTTTAAFSAYVTGASLSAPVDGKLAAKVTLRISGAVTWS